MQSHSFGNQWARTTDIGISDAKNAKKVGTMSDQFLIECEHCGEETLLYRPLEAASYLGVSSGTVATWRREGFLYGVKLGQIYVYTKASLEEALQSKNYDRMNTNVEVTYRDE